jgi:peptidyl-prolyl cis-trans isomerase D
MIAAIRAFAQSWLAKLLLSLLILSFVIFGVGSVRDVFRERIHDAVVTAGSRQVSGDQFKRMFDNYKRADEQQSGQQMSLQEAVAQHLDTRVLQAVATNEAFAEELRRSGLQPAPNLIAEAIRKQPDFFDPVSGRFDKTAYQQKLAENQLTPEMFESLLTDEIAQNHLQEGFAAGFKAPLTYEAVSAGYQFEGRTLSYFRIDPARLPTPPTPSDAQLQSFLNENAAAVRRPEYRTLTVMRFSAKALAPSLPVDAAQVQKLYDFRKDSLSTPEKRSLVQVPAKDAATAAAIVTKLKSGAAPEAAAKSIGAQPIVYTDAPKAAIADSKVADAAFALGAGQVSGPIQGALGFAVIKLISITPAKIATLESMRPQLEAQVRADAASQKIYDAVQKYDDAHSGGASMADAAKAAGGAPTTLGPVTAQGLDMTGRPVAGLTPKLLKDAFNLAQGAESDMEDEGQGEYFAVRVDKVTPPAVPALAEIKQPLTGYFMARETAQAAHAKADELVKSIGKGQTLEAAAASVGATVGHAPDVTRAALMQDRALSPDLSSKLFTAKQGEVVEGEAATGPNSPHAVVVARVDSIRPASVTEAAHAVASQNREFSGHLFQDLGEMARTAARGAVKPTLDPDRARQALGLSAEEAAKIAGGAAGKAP